MCRTPQARTRGLTVGAVQVSRFTRTLTHAGAFDIEVSDGRVRAVTAGSDDPDPSPYGPQLFASDAPARVRQPAVRRSWLDDGPGAGRSRRGHDPFVNVSWDHALELVAAELARVREQHGNEAIFAGSYGWASAGRFHHAQSQLKRFLTLFGGFTAAEDTYSHAAAERVVPRVLGRPFRSFLREHRPITEVADHTELLVSFGGFPDANRYIVNGGTPRHVIRDGLLDARRRGCRFVALTPTRSRLEDELSASWLPLRPGSDVAVLLALLHVLVSEELVDLDRARRWSSGLEILVDHVLGRDGSPGMPPERAAELSGLPTASIRDLARDLATHVSLLNGTWSIQRTEHGEHAVWAVIALATVLGQLDLPGAGMGFGYGSMGSVGAPVCRPGAPALPTGGPNPVHTTIPVARIADLLLHPGTSYRFDGATHRYPSIELIYWAGGNPFHHHQDLHRLERAWQQPATVIVHEPWWTATARRADVVLPTTTALERRDLGGGSADAHLVAMEPALTPVGEARDDHAILRDLSARLGFEDRFTEGRDVDGWLSWLYGQFREDDPDLPGEATFWRLGRVERRPDPHVRRAWDAFLADPASAPLATDSGRIVLAVPAWAEVGLPPYPRWHPPTEWLGAAASTQLHLLSPQPPQQLHSQHDHAGPSGRRPQGREPITLHPEDAAVREIATGDDVRVTSARGRCLATALLSDRVRPGVAVLATGAWWDPAPDVDGELVCRRGNPNVLTRDVGTSGWAQGTTAHTCLVEVRRADDAPKPAPYDTPDLRRSEDV